MAPNWISTAKVLPKSSSSKPKKRCTNSRCPVEETGRNSVSPSTTPRTNALNRSNVMSGSAGNGGKDAGAYRRAGAVWQGRSIGFSRSLTREQWGQSTRGSGPSSQQAEKCSNLLLPSPTRDSLGSATIYADTVPPSVLSAFALRAAGPGRIRYRRAAGRGAGVGAPPRVPRHQSGLQYPGAGGGGPPGRAGRRHHCRISRRDPRWEAWRCAAHGRPAGAAHRGPQAAELVQRQVLRRGVRPPHHGAPI